MSVVESAYELGTNQTDIPVDSGRNAPRLMPSGPWNDKFLVDVRTPIWSTVPRFGFSCPA